MRTLAVVLIALIALVANQRPAAAAPPPWYPPLRWLPASEENYEVGRDGVPITRIVIHRTEGRYEGTLSWFRDATAKVSAHYVVRASDGLITQMVAEKDTAFHARGSNRGTIGIEHEFDTRGGISFTDALYRSSATLVCAIARRYGIPLDRAHVVGHSEVASADHADPGPTWDWSYYMRLLRSCATSATVASAPQDAVAPAPILAYGDAGYEVSLLQWHLAYLGWIAPAQVAAGDGHFGPLTLAAVRGFQSMNGVPATGNYGPLTAAALAGALAAAPSPAAPPGLAFGVSSQSVARLQTDLSRLGYMSAVTGYFGPITEDAVRRFQADHAIEPNGVYGPLTRAAMAAAIR